MKPALGRVGILSVGHALPPRVLTNAELEKMVDTSDEWIRTRTGIEERRIASKGTATSDLGTEAALEALTLAKIDPKKVDLMVVGTTTPDSPMPSAACQIQKKLGVSNAVCFDVAAACAGFVYSLVIAEKFVSTGTYPTALVIGAEVISPFIDWTDRSTCVLFGDGAAACVLKKTGKSKGGIITSHLGSNGDYADLLIIPAGGSLKPASLETIQSREHYLKMNGSEVFKLAVRGMLSAITSCLEKADLKPDDIDCLIPHQANLRIIDSIAERLSFPKEKIYVNLQRYGNTSSASCGLGLYDALQENRIRRGDKILLATFGSGLVWGAMVIEW